MPNKHATVYTSRNANPLSVLHPRFARSVLCTARAAQPLRTRYHLPPRLPFAHSPSRLDLAHSRPTIPFAHCRSHSTWTTNLSRNLRDRYLDAFLTPRQPSATMSATPSPTTEMPSSASTTATSVGLSEPSETPSSGTKLARDQKIAAGRFRQPKEIECWGHRGASAHLPENT